MRTTGWPDISVTSDLIKFENASCVDVIWLYHHNLRYTKGKQIIKIRFSLSINIILRKSLGRKDACEMSNLLV